MCVFVSWRGAFPHTWAICHILGKHSEWGCSAGGFGETGLRRPSSPCIPSSSSPCRVLLVAAHSWWPSATGRVWPHSPGKRGVPPPCWCGVTPLRWGEYGVDNAGDGGMEGAQPCALFWGSLLWPSRLSQNLQTLELSAAAAGQSQCSCWVHAPAELRATSCSRGASADLAVFSPILTRNLSYLHEACTTPGGLAFKIFGCTVTAEQVCAFIGNSSCY